MEKPPAFQFYAADYLADAQVQLMTLEEEGAYIRLLAYCWREGGIPDDDEALSRLCKGASLEVIRAVKKLFSVSEHVFDSVRTGVRTLVHKRLEIERKKQVEFRKKKAQAGVASGKSRRTKKLQDEHVFDSVRTKHEQKRTLQSSSSLITPLPPTRGNDGQSQLIEMPTPGKSEPRGNRTRQEFEEDWPKFWARVGKDSAFRAYEKARKRVSREQLMDAVCRHGPLILQHAQQQGITPVYPASWLNAGRWDDDVGIYQLRPIWQGKQKFEEPEYQEL